MPHLSMPKDFEEEQKMKEQLVKRKVAGLPKDNIIKNQFNKVESGDDREDESELFFAPIIRLLHIARRAFVEGNGFVEVMEDFKEVIDQCIKIYKEDKGSEKDKTATEIEKDQQNEKIRKEGEQNQKQTMGERLTKALSLDKNDNKEQNLKTQ